MDASTRDAWLAELGRARGATFDAPSWLWSSVVDLLAVHEAAYLEHCRRFVLSGAARTILPPPRYFKSPERQKR